MCVCVGGGGEEVKLQGEMIEPARLIKQPWQRRPQCSMSSLQRRRRRDAPAESGRRRPKLQPPLHPAQQGFWGRDERREGDRWLMYKHTHIAHHGTCTIIGLAALVFKQLIYFCGESVSGGGGTARCKHSVASPAAR